MAVYADDIKNILYILPALSAIICGLFVYFLNKTSAAHASTKSDWSDVQIGGGGGGGGVLSIVQNDAELENVKNIGIVLEYNDLALEAHARKGKITSSASEIKKSINDLMLKCGLHSAACTQRGKEAKSQIMFTGSIEKMKKAIWQVRETLSWVRSIQGMDDVGTAYTVQQVGKGFKARIQFEACVILFNAE